MSFTGVFGLVILGIVAIAILGPSKLPLAVEQIWLTITNFRLSQEDRPSLTLDQARRMWDASDSPLYDLVQILYGSVEHLQELRRRIFMVLGTLVGAAVVAAIFVDPIMRVLVKPRGDVQLIFTAPTDMLFTYIEVVISAAAVVALPVLVYEILMFIRPALEGDSEVRTFRAIAALGMPLVLVFFILGLMFAYYIMMPFALRYLAGFGGDIARPTWTIRAYYSFALALLLWIGAAFETPLIMAVLARLGLVSPQAMMKQWRYAIVGIAVIAAVITPTVDPVNMSIVMAPLLVLYFLGILMSRAVYHPRETSTIEESEPEAGAVSS